MGMTSDLKQGTTRILTRGALIAACGLAAAACGSAAAPTAAAPASSASSGAASTGATTSAAKVSLRIEKTGGSGSAPQHWTLQCEPAGGSFPDPATACAKLTKLRTIFSPAQRHVMCPMIMADARSYIVSGTFLGQKVHQSIVDGGCQLSRWSQLNQIFN
jgi:hypothetical protein